MKLSWMALRRERKCALKKLKQSSDGRLQYLNTMLKRLRDSNLPFTDREMRMIKHTVYCMITYCHYNHAILFMEALVTHNPHDKGLA